MEIKMDVSLNLTPRKLERIAAIKTDIEEIENHFGSYRRLYDSLV